MWIVNGDDHNKSSIMIHLIAINLCMRSHCWLPISFVGKWWHHRCDEFMAQLRNYSDEHFELKLTKDSEWHGKCSITAIDELQIHSNRMIAAAQWASILSYIYIFRKREIYLVAIRFGHWICSMFNLHCSLYYWFHFGFDVTLTLQFQVLIVGDDQIICRHEWYKYNIVSISCLQRSSYC